LNIEKRIEIREKEIIMMGIELVDAEDVKGRGNSKGKGKYGKYREGLGPHVGWLKEEIEKSPDGKVRIKTSDILKIIGPGVGKNATSIYWGVRYTLFQDGLAVSQGTHKSGEDLLVIRTANDEDMLPTSLSGIVADTDIVGKE
jgi:hypothetical protein